MENNDWKELYLLWSEFASKAKAFQRRFTGQHPLQQTPDPALVEGLRQVEANCQHVFQTLAMTTFFESSFEYYGVESNTGPHGDIQNPDQDSCCATSPDQMASILSGLTDQDEDDSEEVEEGLDQELALLASGSSGRASAIDTSHCPLPTLAELSDEQATSLFLLEDMRTLEQMQQDGFTDLIVYANAKVNKPDCKQLFRDYPMDRFLVPGRMPNKTGSSTENPFVGYSGSSIRLANPVQLSCTVASSRSEKIKLAKSLKRKDLLEMMNEFCGTFGLPPVSRRDLLWTHWFLGDYLRLSHEDRITGKPLIVLDKRTNTTFHDAVANLYSKLFSHHPSGSPEKKRKESDHRSVSPPVTTVTPFVLSPIQTTV